MVFIGSSITDVPDGKADEAAHRAYAGVSYHQGVDADGTDGQIYRGGVDVRGDVGGVCGGGIIDGIVPLCQVLRTARDPTLLASVSTDRLSPIGPGSQGCWWTRHDPCGAPARANCLD